MLYYSTHTLYLQIKPRAFDVNCKYIILFNVILFTKLKTLHENERMYSVSWTVII